MGEYEPLKTKITHKNEAINYIQELGTKSEWCYILTTTNLTSFSLTIKLSHDKSVDGIADMITITITIDKNIIDNGISFNELEIFFKDCIQVLNPFYSFCDFVENMVAKHKKNGYPVNIQNELPGIFWLTYFNSQYCEYFDLQNKNINLDHIKKNYGLVIKLGDSPSNVTFSRLEVEEILGKKSFVDPNDTLDKPFGKYVFLLSDIK